MLVGWFCGHGSVLRPPHVKSSAFRPIKLEAPPAGSDQPHSCLLGAKRPIGIRYRVRFFDSQQATREWCRRIHYLENIYIYIYIAVTIIFPVLLRRTRPREVSNSAQERTQNSKLNCGSGERRGTTVSGRLGEQAPRFGLGVESGGPTRGTIIIY